MRSTLPLDAQSIVTSTSKRMYANVASYVLFFISQST